MEKTIRDLVFRMMGCSAEAADVADVCSKAVSVISEGDVCLVVEDESLLNKLRAATEVVSIAPDDKRPFVLADSRLYTRRNWRYEAQARERAMEMAGTGGSGGTFEIPPELECESPMPGQREAVIKMNSSNYSILTGGPGTGKTFTITWAVKVALYRNPNLRIELAAPTGKAAGRMTESFRGFKVRNEELRAKTLHTLLGPNADFTTFKHNRDNPLDIDWLIVDEASMIDLPMMSKLLDALPKGCRLTLVGDEYQLASVERGRVFGDLCHAEWMQPRIARLTVSRRFKHGGEIDVFAKAVNAGDSDKALDCLNAGGDMIVYRHLREEGMTNPDSWPEFTDIITNGLHKFTEAKTAEEALFYLNVFRVLCVERHGAFGINRVNEYMVRKLAGSLRHPHCPIPVMITRNDKSLNVANGDVGVRMPDDPSNICLLVEDAKDAKDIKYRKVRTELLDNVETAFAMTVHKSQGSEFRDVAIILPPDAESRLLTREILYTGVTRTKHMVYIYGSDKAVEKSCKNQVKRITGFAEEG